MFFTQFPLHCLSIMNHRVRVIVSFLLREGCSKKEASLPAKRQVLFLPFPDSATRHLRVRLLPSSPYHHLRYPPGHVPKEPLKENICGAAGAGFSIPHPGEPESIHRTHSEKWTQLQREPFGHEQGILAVQPVFPPQQSSNRRFLKATDSPFSLSLKGRH